MKSFHSLLTSAVVASLIASTSLYADRGHDRGHGRGFDYGYDRGHRDYSPRMHRERHHRHNVSNWVVPLVVGGAIGYALSDPRRSSVSYVSSPAPVYPVQGYSSVSYTSSPAYTPQGYGAVSYGSSPVYEERWVYFSDCACERKVLVQIR